MQCRRGTHKCTFELNEFNSSIHAFNISNANNRKENRLTFMITNVTKKKIESVYFLGVSMVQSEN